ENFVADWMKKLSHLKSETLSQDILDIITKHASNKKRPELTKEVKEKIEEELKTKLPLKKEETSNSEELETITSSDNTVQTPSNIETQKAEIERGRQEELENVPNPDIFYKKGTGQTLDSFLKSKNLFDYFKELTPIFEEFQLQVFRTNSKSYA